ncbi:MAG TPA: 1-acyl-sn-glycerol-3-phosphate acyltransferase [Propionicimonas sp.]|nr:1-acyl-sn-glycerol-3-phosphate acyltransferase [Propionicimonas sp.]HQA76928.1 1-acyl-sn-glycerol-3-phosphate acyltransferase [Propionicimonas sp.]HQD96466.1 1-acyl-sn-glycerol-3-phosphate acyltransferase [Propionicimonas sp.]
MIVRPMLARAYWALSRYRLQSEPPPDTSAVLIGAPHTSNWDFVIMLAISWQHGVAPRWLGKHTLFKAPFGRLMRALGGIPVNRANPGRLVAEVVELAQAEERVFIVVTPEGTRHRGKLWKSGFYRIARDANLPLVLGYVDSATRTAGLGPTMHLSGDVVADMDQLRAFYADKHGIRPEDFTPPRLREEGSAESPK